MKKYSYDSLITVVKKIGFVYIKNKREIDINKINCFVNEEDFNLQKYVSVVDRALLDCCKETQHIIRNEYLMKNDSNWYLEYYTKSTFYRLKSRAIKEFLHCLNK